MSSWLVARSGVKVNSSRRTLSEWGRTRGWDRARLGVASARRFCRSWTGSGGTRIPVTRWGGSIDSIWGLCALESGFLALLGLWAAFLAC
jgi:hypothetical protein